MWMTGLVISALANDVEDKVCETLSRALRSVALFLRVVYTSQAIQIASVARVSEDATAQKIQKRSETIGLPGEADQSKRGIAKTV